MHSERQIPQQNESNDDAETENSQVVDASQQPSESLGTLFKKEPTIETLTMMPDGSLAVCCADWTIKIWDVSKNEKIKEYDFSKFPSQSLIRGSSLIYFRDDSEITVHDLLRDKTLCTFPASNSDKMKELIASPSSKTLGCLMDDLQSIYLWDLPCGKIDLDKKEEHQLIKAGDKISHLIFQSDDTLLLGLNNGNVEKWQREDNTFIWRGTLIGNGNKNTPVTELIPVLNMFACYKQQISLLQLFDQDFKLVAEIETQAELNYFSATKDGILAASEDNPAVYFYSVPSLKESVSVLEDNIDSLIALPSGEAVVLCVSNILLVDSPELHDQKGKIAQEVLKQTFQGPEILVDLMLDYVGFFSGRKPIVSGDVSFLSPQNKKITP
jgi:hypothetical protein